MSVWSKLIMLGASIALSAWAMKGGEMDEKAILGVLAVLMVHELGHFLAMWIFGYRNLGILFIPFFGAVAVSGKKPDVPAWKEIAVVLAGPVPGLIAGVAAIYFDYWGHAWLNWPACFSVILNALNLLPVLPMDGGHLLRLAIRARWPRLQALLQTLSALGMIGMGLFMGKVLLYLGVAQLLRLGVPWFVASVVRREHRAFSRISGPSRDPHDHEAAHRQAFYSIWADPKYRKQPAVARQTIAMQIGEELRARPAGFFATCAALLGCTCLFWTPIAAWFGVGIYAEHQITTVQQENTAAGVPSTMEEAREQSVCLPDPVNAKRWAAIMRVVASVDAQSPVLKAIDTINAEATIRAQREASARPAAGDEDADPVVLRKGELDALSPTLPDEVPEPLARFIADLRLAIVNEPEDLSADAATIADDFNLNPLGLLCRDARRHLKSGRLGEWKTDVLACARALECAPGMTQRECAHREVHVGQLIAVVEEGWPLLVKQPDAAFVSELAQRLPTPDELMRQRAVAVFTDEPIGMDLNVVAVDGGVDLSAVSKFTDWLNHSPPARMLYLEGLKQRRVLWQSVNAQTPADWPTLCADLQTKLGSIAMLAPPEVATLVNLGITYQTQQRSLRPSWELFLAAAKLQSADAGVVAKLAKNYPREKLSDGSEALVIKPTKSEGDVLGFFAPQPVVWRLKK
jgi:Zn-dependent protease